MRGGKALPLYTRIAAIPGAPPTVVVPADQRPLACSTPAALRPVDMSWHEFLLRGDCAEDPGLFEPYIADPYEPTNILFSSGTTGLPKAIPWTHLTPLRCCG